MIYNNHKIFKCFYEVVSFKNLCGHTSGNFHLRHWSIFSRVHPLLAAEKKSSNTFWKVINRKEIKSATVCFKDLQWK
jgi:hypothetical protein